METRSLKLIFASLCLMLFSTTAFADGVMIGPCGTFVVVGEVTNLGTAGECKLDGGGLVVHGGRTISGQNHFLTHHMQAFIDSESGQHNVFVVTIITTPNWTVAGPVLTRLALNGTIDILEPGATVDVVFTGALGGPPLVIERHFTESGSFSVEIFGMQAINNLATSTLTITVNGFASFSAAGPGREFEGVAIPEPASLLLLGFGLLGTAARLRKRRKK
ncbi:MAG TPA: PEP-CTERM sorting domain-containing protein [Pyrinomonadaceae bacterium]|nr:PEP-CTERM sorting domain-containing protein [Pyrinomonadaceae bacterium]